MARTLLCHFCATLIAFLKEIIFSQDFLERHRLSPNAFTRNRKLPFPVLIFFLINLIKGSNQDELDGFFQALHDDTIAQRMVSKSALTKARKNLDHKAFIELNQEAIHFFEKHFQPEKWHGFTLVAVDGSTARVPRNEEVAEHFGQWHPAKGDPCPLARVSQMFDVLNHVTLDAIISPKKIGERELAADHFLNLMPKDLVLMDRGYPAFWLFKLIECQDAQFCARVKAKSWNVVQSFSKSRKKDQIVTLKPSISSKEKCREMGIEPDPIQVRLIKVKSECGDMVILITSLLDKEVYPYEIFDQLYHMRWPVEEDYKCMKSRIEIENWSGKSVLSVYQDFHAKVFAKNLTSMLACSVKPAIEQRCRGRKYPYQINFTQALSKMKDTIVRLFNRSADVVLELIMKLQELFINTTEPIRLGRKFPRKPKIRPDRFSPPYKRPR